MEPERVPVRNDPNSLAPIQLERTSLEDDVASMKSGKGLRLAATLLVTAAAVVGGTQLLGAMDTHQAYAHAAEQLEVIDAQQSEAFLRCALPNLQRTQLSTPTALHTAIEIVSERMDKQYGRLLGQCEPLLQSFEQAVNQVKAPSDMTRRLQALSVAAGDLGRSWTDYRTYLQDPAQRYDYVQAAPRIEKITLAWSAYQTQRTQAKEALSARR
jgi:hypothetical protein